MEEESLDDPNDVVPDGKTYGLSRAHLDAILNIVLRFSRKERSWWLRMLAEEFMSKRQEGNPALHSRIQPKQATPLPPLIQDRNKRENILSRRKCNAAGCKVTTCGACHCTCCISHGMGGVVICKYFFTDEGKRSAAGRGRSSDSKSAHAVKDQSCGM